jgi:hypothetical protein
MVELGVRDTARVVSLGKSDERRLASGEFE